MIYLTFQRFNDQIALFAIIGSLIIVLKFLQYGDPPQSWFQKLIRGQEKQLYDHIAKEMNELNYIRCQRIPKRPGADWRDLPEEKVSVEENCLLNMVYRYFASRYCIYGWLFPKVLVSYHFIATSC